MTVVFRPIFLVNPLSKCQTTVNQIFSMIADELIDLFIRKFVMVTNVRDSFVDFRFARNQVFSIRDILSQSTGFSTLDGFFSHSRIKLFFTHSDSLNIRI